MGETPNLVCLQRKRGGEANAPADLCLAELVMWEKPEAIRLGRNDVLVAKFHVIWSEGNYSRSRRSTKRKGRNGACRREKII